jgi:hypothetical protein
MEVTNRMVGVHVKVKVHVPTRCVKLKGAQIPYEPVMEIIWQIAKVRVSHDTRHLAAKLLRIHPGPNLIAHLLDDVLVTRLECSCVIDASMWYSQKVAKCHPGSLTSHLQIRWGMIQVERKCLGPS